MADQGHWYTDKNGNHYLVKDGETPKEGWERSKRRKMIDGGKYKVDDGDGKGPREVSMEEYNKYEADDDFDETTDDDFGFDEEEDESGYYAAATDFNPEEMSDRTAVIENVPQGVLFDNDADMQDLIDTFEVGITGDPEHGYTITGRPGDIKSLYETYDLQNEKLDINFRDGAWEPQGGDEEESEDESGDGSGGDGSLENTDNRGESLNGVDRKEAERLADGFMAGDGNPGVADEGESKNENENPQPAANENLQNVLTKAGIKTSMDPIVDGENVRLFAYTDSQARRWKEKLEKLGYKAKSSYDQGAYLVNFSLRDSADNEDENNATNNRKELLNQMEGIRNEEREKERSLLEEFGNGSISYDEFKNRESQLHQEVQDRVDSLYEKLNGKSGKKNPNGSTDNKNEGQIDERKINHIEEYFNIWGKPSERELPDVVKHYGLNEKEAAELKKRLGRK